jgi:hypothetical protein
MNSLKIQTGAINPPLVTYHDDSDNEATCGCRLGILVLKAEDAQTPSFTYLFLMSTEGWDAGTPSLSSLLSLERMLVYVLTSCLLR